MISRQVINGQTRFLGACKRDDFDHNDFIMKAPAPALDHASLRPDWKLAIRNQGQRGTCVANGTLEAAGWNYVRDGKPDPVLSRLFLYYYGRKLEGTSPSNDTGLQIRDGFKAFSLYGACSESLWQYSDDSTAFTIEPPHTAYAEAQKHKGLFFYRCPDLNTIKASIAQRFPVVYGVNLPQNAMSEECAATGVIKIPAPGEGFVGGHCMVYAGWDDRTQMLYGPNSWGTGYGDDGWVSMSYRFVEEGYVSDCWTLRKVQE